MWGRSGVTSSTTSRRATEDERLFRVALWGDLDMNLIDGSSISLQSVAQLLAEDPRVRLTILLKRPVSSELVTAPLERHPRIELVQPDTAELGAADALDWLERMDKSGRFDLVVLRGVPTLAEVAARDRFDGRLWLYYVARYTDDDVLRVLVREEADRILCPTERMRAHVLEAAPHTPDKTLTMPPMIPRVEPAELPESGETPQLHVYAGTVSRAYRFFETVAMLRRLRRRYPRAELAAAPSAARDGAAARPLQAARRTASSG